MVVFVETVDFSQVCLVAELDAETHVADVLLSLPVVLMQLPVAVVASQLDLADATMVATDVETLAETLVIHVVVHLATEPSADEFGFQRSSAARFQFVLPSSDVKKSLTLTV